MCNPDLSAAAFAAGEMAGAVSIFVDGASGDEHAFFGEQHGNGVVAEGVVWILVGEDFFDHLLNP